jgi:hypothetical protein
MPSHPDRHENRLALETSPYLRQHATNPVDWYPWSAEALERARREDKPILLSIGYSACHWCHVMAHESFEHEPTARVMNELFINIKVDREERPDIDRVYQVAQQIITQRGGGWPLTMFLAPDDHLPFFGGTYFPRDAGHGMPSFADLLRRVERYYREQQPALREQNTRLAAVFADLAPSPPAPGTMLDGTPLVAARAALERSFDKDFGGFSLAPKFPSAGSIERLLRHWSASQHHESPDLQALYMATLSLARMAEGGLYDHVGGGFARYSVDAWWMIPHFEKMLYDNGPLLALYAQAAIATGDMLYRDAANGTADWVLREMQAPDGGFYSSIDADSEGEEGRYYVWDAAEVAALLPADEHAALAVRFGLDRPPNFEQRHWHLHAFLPVAEVAAATGKCENSTRARIRQGLARLLEARALRVAPARDDKVLTSWNALMVRGLAIAARSLDRPDLESAATRAVDFIRRELWKDGRLYATHKDGRSHVAAYLDDYVLLADALLELLQVRWRSADLEFAVALVEAALAHFEDRADGGFWFTADDGEALIHRTKAFADEALPAGNGIAARVLARLGYLLGEPRYLAASERTLQAAWSAMQRYPSAHAALLDALEEHLAPTEVVVLRGPAATIRDWQGQLNRLYAPRRMILAIDDDAGPLPAALAGKPSTAAGIAYVCNGTTCEAPIDEFATLVRRLRDGIVA